MLHPCMFICLSETKRFCWVQCLTIVDVSYLKHNKIKCNYYRPINQCRLLWILQRWLRGNGVWQSGSSPGDEVTRCRTPRRGNARTTCCWCCCCWSPCTLFAVRWWNVHRKSGFYRVDVLLEVQSFKSGKLQVLLCFRS